jgi:hypothetical protein
MRSGMPLYRNHFRRSRDAPEVDRDQLHFNIHSREVNRTYLDANRSCGDSLRPTAGLSTTRVSCREFPAVVKCRPLFGVSKSTL